MINDQFNNTSEVGAPWLTATTFRSGFGHEWLTGFAGCRIGRHVRHPFREEPILVPCRPPTQEQPASGWRAVEPMRDLALFRRFADLADLARTPARFMEAVQNFFDAYGALDCQPVIVLSRPTAEAVQREARRAAGDPNSPAELRGRRWSSVEAYDRPAQEACTAEFWAPRGSSGGHLVPRVGELRSSLVFQTTKIQAMASLLDLLRQQPPNLAVRLELKFDEWLRSVAETEAEPEADGTEGHGPYNPFAFSDTGHEMALSRRQSPEDRATSLLLLEVNAMLARHAKPRVRVGKPAQFASDTLIGALYAQLAMDVSGELGMMKRCPCGNWFLLKDARQIYCGQKGNTCNQAAYRLRRAARMRSEPSGQ